jgi:hypothetical protein
MDFQELKVGDFAYFERLTASIKVLGRECRRDVKPILGPRASRLTLRCLRPWRKPKREVI